MSDSDRLWKLQGFPETVGPPSALEVQRAYEQWKERCQTNPYIGATPVDVGGERHTAIIWGTRHPDDYSPEQQFVCDFDINPGPWGVPGEVIYVDSGFI